MLWGTGGLLLGTHIGIVTKLIVGGFRIEFIIVKTIRLSELGRSNSKG
jgi:hypothetical protein